MDRKKFLQTLSLLPLGAAAYKLGALQKLSDGMPPTPRMPVLFLGHGTPMNAIVDNPFSREFERVGKQLPRPRAILCVSAHWETRGTFVTAMENPRTIHDFGGFPKALFDQQYPAPGSPELALEAQSLVTSTAIGLDQNWGLDHGCWTVVKFLFPKADIPVVQMSIDMTQPAAYHYAMAQELSALRRKGVLIIGSGNSVHNLGLVAWDKLDGGEFAFDWALQANDFIRQAVLSGDHGKLIHFGKQGRELRMAVPTPEHYLPMLYVLALQEKDEKPLIFNDSIVGGSLNMMSIKIDSA